MNLCEVGHYSGVPIKTEFIVERNRRPRRPCIMIRRPTKVFINPSGRGPGRRAAIQDQEPTLSDLPVFGLRFGAFWYRFTSSAPGGSGCLS